MNISRNINITICLLFKTLLIVSGLSLIGGSIVMAGMNGEVELGQITNDKWNQLEKKRIFFAHHSVGNDILDGIEKIQTQYPEVKINVVKLDNPENITKTNEGAFFHGSAGENFDPLSKVSDFVEWNEKSIGGNVDVAFMKFCFVDITTRTDVPALFKNYRDNLLNLKNKYPKTKFVHVTVPLVSEKQGLAKWKHKLKGVIKGILGKDEFYENKKKYVFNEMMRKEYKGKEPVFDLAAIESTFPNGNRSIEGDNVESMVPEYTTDGGHLTPLGKEVVAEKLLIFLTDMD